MKAKPVFKKRDPRALSCMIATMLVDYIFVATNKTFKITDDVLWETLGILEMAKLHIYQKVMSWCKDENKVSS